MNDQVPYPCVIMVNGFTHCDYINMMPGSFKIIFLYLLLLEYKVYYIALSCYHDAKLAKVIQVQGAQCWSGFAES